MIDNQKMSIILPARIVEYFPENQTATIQICIDTIYSDAIAISESKAREPLEEVPYRVRWWMGFDYAYQNWRYLLDVF